MRFCAWKMRPAFQAVPKELEDAAYIEGVTGRIAFWKVTLSLTVPSIAVDALIALLIGYTELRMDGCLLSEGRM